MSITYTPTTNFASKDGLPANDPSKVVKGAEFTTEFTAIQSAFALATPSSNPTVTGTATFDDVSVGGDLAVTGVLNANGALNVTGAFTSPGIDDNANATAITINSSEYVGVGNPAPISKFDVYQTDPTKEISRLRLWGNTNNPMLIVAGDEADHSIDFRATGSTSGCDLSFTTSGFERMRISDNGVVGITGDVTVKSTYPSIDLIDTDATLGLGTRVVTSSDSFLISALNSAGSYVQDIYKVNMNANGPTLHSWTTESAGTAMALSNGGTLGIGTSAPNSSGLLEIQANSTNGKSGSGLLMLTNTQSTVAAMTFNTTGNDYSIGSSGTNIFNVYDITNATTPFAIDPNTPSSTLKLSSAGRVGIGTSSPAYTLEVEDSPTTTGAPQVAISAGVVDVDGVLAFPLAGASKGSIISNKPLTFHTGTTVNTANERMRIDNSGNVGIGTDVPARPLHVNDVMRLEPRATAPSNPSAGDIYFSSVSGGDNGVLRCYDGAAWQSCF